MSKVFCKLSTEEVIFPLEQINHLILLQSLQTINKLSQENQLNVFYFNFILLIYDLIQWHLL